jgi:hypothetical protein
MLCGAVPAAAGTYEVHACGGAAGAAQNAFAAVADPNMSAYSICPPTSAAGTGIATKATSNGGKAGYLAGAYQIFEAPPGSVVESVTFNPAAIRLAEYWTAGIVAYDNQFNSDLYLPYGCYAFHPGCAFGTPSFTVPVTVDLRGRSRFRFETRCGSVSGCSLAASSFSPPNQALFSAANVTVRVFDASAPSIVPRSGALWSTGWHRGVEDAWSTYRDNVGVMITRLWVDWNLRDNQDYRLPTWPASVRCDFTRRRPCSDVDPGSVGLDTRTLADGEHYIRIEAVDTAGNVTGIDRMISVDNTIPGRPSGIAVAGGEAWRTANGFRVRWSSSRDGAAPVSTAHFRLCPIAGGICVEGTRSGSVMDGLDDIRVPRPGDYELRGWLEDAAGNQDPERAAGPVHLRFDDVAPTFVFDRPSRRDPALLAARVHDAHSGVAGASVEIRRRGGGAWHELDSRLTGDRLTARVDDEALPDGDYVVRGIARDSAGNKQVSSLEANGDPLELTLPLRTPTVVTLRAACPGAPRCRSGRAGPGHAGTVRAGSTIVRGAVRTAGGLPVAGAEILVTERPRAGAGPRRVASVKAGRDGAFAARLRAGPTRTVRFRHVGDASLRPAVAELRLLAPARSSIAADRRMVPNGSTVTFTGRLRGGPIPDGGKLIDLQAFFRRRWRTFATPRTNSLGEWSYRYRFEATVGRVVYRFRARIRREAAYPYELGRSRVIRVTVVG